MEAITWNHEPLLSADELLDLLGDDESFLDLGHLESVCALPLAAEDMPSCASAQVEMRAAPVAMHSPSQLVEASKKKTSFQRQKDEAAQLKSLVAELQAKMLSLRGVSRVSGASQHNNSSSVTSFNQSLQKAALTLSFWRVVAQRQLHERREAEQENAALRKMLKEQALLAKSLERMIRKRPLLLKAQQETSCRGRAATTSQKDSDIFQVLLSNVDERMHTIGSFLREKNLTPTVTDVNSTIIVSSNDSQDMQVECKKAQVLPFNSRAISDVMWTQMRRNLMVLPNTKLQTHVLKHTDELLITKHETPCNAKTRSTFGTLTVFSVTKRVTKADRVHLVWEYLVERTGSVVRGDPLIYLNIHGCGQLVGTTSGEGQQPATLSQSHVRLVPVYIEAPRRGDSMQPQQKFDNKVFIDNVIKVHQLNVQQLSVFVQNALVGGCR